MNARKLMVLEHWKFKYGEQVGAEETSYLDSSWQAVRVPHDWAINQAFDMNIDKQLIRVKEDGERFPQLRTGRTGALPAFGIAWYRKTIESTTSMQGKRIAIEFDGAMSLSKIYLNGKYVGEWPYGYSSFSFDLSDHWNYNGKNVLAVRLNNQEQSSRWYSGAGLYRQVRLVFTDPIHIAHWGTYISTPSVNTSSASVQIQTSIENNTKKAERIVLKTSLFDAQGNQVASGETSQLVDEYSVFDQGLSITNPQLWSLRSPTLYSALSEVYVNGELRDQYRTSWGIRSLLFDQNKGFFLNGEHVKIKGVCMHHDLGPLGTAINKQALERQLNILKEMGCNAIRTSHNPPAPELLNLCDSLGFLVMDEAFDEWKSGKNENSYHLYFDEWHEKDLVAMIHRDRNHPSVIMWSIGNEVREQNQSKGGNIAQELVNICKREDPTRPVTAGFNNHNAAIRNGLANSVDLVGFNYKPQDYLAKHKKYPNYILYGSETASTVSSRGVYKFPAEENKNAYYDDYQVSSYDYDFPNWATTPDKEFEQQDDCDFILGEFVWTGFDYLGEPTPYNEGTPARSSYFGIVDLAGLKKDRYYLYQSQWSEQKVLHLLPHWNWFDRIGQKVPVYCYTNYPQTELFMNGVSQGLRTKLNKNTYTRYRMMWEDVVYEPGEIKVVAYDEGGKKVASERIRTAGAMDQIKMTPDQKQLSANGKDLCFITIEILDKDGNLCPRANPMLFFEVQGNAKLKAVCNGDPTDQTAFSSNYMRAFNGKLVLIIESAEQAGQATVRVFGGKLKYASVSLKIK